MAPDAPAPVYDSHGNQVGGWTVTVQYHPVRDILELSARNDGGTYTKATTSSEQFLPQDLEDVIAVMQRTIRIMGARRLF